MGSEAIRTQDLVINYVDDDVSKGALWNLQEKPLTARQDCQGPKT